MTVNRIRPGPLRTVGNFGTESSFGSLSDNYRKTVIDPWHGVGEVRAEMARRYQFMRLFRLVKGSRDVGSIHATKGSSKDDK